MEERKDPLSLWVGSWTPEEIVEREKLRGKTKDRSPEDDAENSEQR